MAAQSHIILGEEGDRRSWSEKKDQIRIFFFSISFLVNINIKFLDLTLFPSKNNSQEFQV